MTVLSRARQLTKRLLEARNSPPLKVKPFDAWSDELDEALAALPEEEIFPHELFRLLMKSAAPEKRKLLLVTEGGEPVALAGLRNRWGAWVPVTHWLVPGVLFPAKEGYLGKVLPALGVEMTVAWWRFQGPPPEIRGMADLQSEPTHGILFSDDYESYWRNSSHFKSIRKCRNRCKSFELRVDPPGGGDWVLTNCEEKWQVEGVDTASLLTEMRVIADFLQERGLFHSLILFDGETPAAGATVLIHRNEMVAHRSYRNPAFDWHGAMTCLVEHVFSWGREVGANGFDLGGSFDYKAHWAPEKGTKWKFRLCPEKRR